MDTIETNDDKITKSIRFEPTLHAALVQLTADEDRPSLNNMVERLLKTHPRIQPILEAGQAETAVAQ